MKIINTTDHSNRMLRRMVSWCCRQLDLKVGYVNEANFRNRSRRCYSGVACKTRRGGRIVVSIAKTNELFPVKCRRRGPIQNEYADRIEALVGVTAHELSHLCQYQDERHKLVEHDSEWHEQHVLNAFRANRESLLSEWNDAPKVTKKTSRQRSVQEKRADRVACHLQRWERKLKLAKTKVATYRKKTRYYEKAIAAKRQRT